MLNQSRMQFDLQQFGGSPKLLSDPVINELSMIFGEHKGEKWAPRNSEAVVLGLKGGKSEKAHRAPRPEFMKLVVDNATKGKSATEAAAIEAELKKGWLVNDDVPDNIDGDGDGSEDYEKIASLIAMVGGDIEACWWINDSAARSMAVCTAIDNFIKNLDDVRGGGMGDVAKAGKRHSKADKEHIDKIADAAKTMTTAMGKMQTHVDALNSNKTASATDDGAGDDDAEKAKREAAAKAVTVTDAIVAPNASTLVADVITALQPILAAQKAGFETMLATQSSSIDAKLAANATQLENAAKATSEKTDVLKASVDAMVSAARAPVAPGALATLEVDGSIKGGDTQEVEAEIKAPALDPNMPVDQAFKAIAENAKKARGRGRQPAS